MKGMRKRKKRNKGKEAPKAVKDPLQSCQRKGFNRRYGISEKGVENSNKMPGGNNISVENCSEYKSGRKYDWDSVSNCSLTEKEALK